LVELKGYEADDVIGSLARNYAPDLEVIIVTGDLDELQLVDSKIKVYSMRRGFTDTILYDQRAVEEKYGITPRELVTYKALKGDSSDNIPGVTGIGDKIASSLAAKFKTLDRIYQNLDLIPPKIAQKLEKEKSKAYLSLQLSQIKTDLKLNFKLEDARLHDYDRSKVYQIFQKLNFKSLLNKLPPDKRSKNLDTFSQPSASHSHLKDVNYQTINQKSDFNKLIAKLTKQKVIAVDLETDSLDIINANLVGISFCYQKGEAYYIPLGHLKGEQLNLNLVLSGLKSILENPSWKIPILPKWGII